MRILRGLAVTLLITGGPAHAAPEESEREYTPAEVRAELDELYARLQASHYDLFARRARPEYERKLEQMRAGIREPLSASDLRTFLQRFVAYGRIAHARIDFPVDAFEAYRKAGGGSFPISLRVVAGRAYIADNLSGVEGIVPGDELLAVDGTPVRTWLDRLLVHLSADTAYMADTMLEWSLPRLVWLEHPTARAFQLRVRTGTGAPRERQVLLRTAAELAAAREQQPRRLELSEDREHRMLDGEIAYLRPGAFYETDPAAPDPWDPRGFEVFVDRAFEDFLRAKARVLLVDLRDNPGGDNSFSDLMVRWFATRPFRFASRFEIKVSEAAVQSNRERLRLAGARPDPVSARLDAAYAGRKPGDKVLYEIPLVAPREGKRFRGEVYVLVNRHSYSNTVMVAALVQDYRFGTILGEETSDLATTIGAMEQFTLSRSGIPVGFPKALIVRPSGAMIARGVVPDIAIPTPIVETADDPVLAAALKVIRKKPRR